MARRPPKSDRFQHSPFKPLKGLPVSGQPPAAPPAAERRPPPRPEADDAELFSREMSWLEVRPLAGGAGAGEGGTPAAPEAAKAAAADDADDASLFLAAVGRLDRTFKDEVPAPSAPPRAHPRRARQLERGTLVPAATLDLHGLVRDEAVARSRAFLEHAARQGWEAVLIVTGKGLHSDEGPVLRRAVERLLAEAVPLVLEWQEAPRRYGGSGALVVFPRSSRPRDGA
jgi:DNA-nicking Smr family endonuclease